MSSKPERSGPLRNPALTAAQCRRVCETRKSNSDITLAQLSQRFGVGISTIARVLKGKYTPRDN